MRSRLRCAAIGCALLVMLLGAGACSWSIGGTEEAQVRPTLGEELRDLHQARKDGVITEDEYRQAKARLLSGRDSRH